MIEFPRKYIQIFFLVIFLFLQACSGADPEPPPEEPIKLKTQMLPFMTFAISYIAEEEGYFDEQGLDVEFINMFTSEAIVALSQGDLDIISGFLSIGTMNAIAEGENIRMVAGNGFIDSEGCIFQALLARKDLVEEGELDNVEQLQGLTISMDSVTVEGYIVQELLNTVGLTLDDIEANNLNSPVVDLEAFETGAIDLTASTEPWVTRTVQAGNAIIWMPYSEIAPDFQITVILFGPSIMERDPDVGQRYLTAYYKAVRQYNEGKTDRNMELMMAFTEMERELLEQVCWPHIRNDGSINEQSVIDFQNWAAARGLLDNVVSIDQFLDTSFIDYVNETLDTSP